MAWTGGAMDTTHCRVSRGWTMVLLFIWTFSMTGCMGEEVPKQRVYPQLPGLPPPDALSSPHGQCWVFTHLQKAGGSTVKNIMQTHMLRDVDVYDTKQWMEGNDYARIFSLYLLHGDSTSIAAGGYTEALRGELGETCKWFVMFRHPIPRLVSAYYYCQYNPVDPACGTHIMPAKQISLEEFARHWGNFGLRQLILSFIPPDDVIDFYGTKRRPRKIPGWYRIKLYLNHRGGMSGGDENTVMVDMLYDVRNLIRDEFDAVGILEEFGTTLELFDRALQMPNITWTASFRSSGVANKDHHFVSEESNALMDAWTNARIKSYISLDLLVYEHAVSVFEDQAKRYGLK